MDRGLQERVIRDPTGQAQVDDDGKGSRERGAECWLI